MHKPVLTNFNIPADMRSRLDEACMASGRTRTSVLIELIEGYIQDDQLKNSQPKGRYRRNDRPLRENRRIKSFKQFLADQLPGRQNDDLGRSQPVLSRAFRSRSDQQGG